jgi:hypothetical protein
MTEESTLIQIVADQITSLFKKKKHGNPKHFDVTYESGFDFKGTQKKVAGLKTFSGSRLNLNLVEAFGVFFLHYVMNLSELTGNLN